MRYPKLSLLPLVVSLMACSAGVSNESTADGQADGPIETTMDEAGSEAPPVSVSDQPNQAPSSKGDQYQLLGIKDPDFGIMAVAMKIPRGWLSKQAFQREWNGAMPINKIYIVFRSPDAKQQIEYFPVSQYVYSDGPGPNNLRMQKRSMGIDTRMAENELPPMSALIYLKRYVLPQMAQNGVTLQDIGNARETAPHADPAPGSNEPRMASSASVDGVLPNGNQARVEIRLVWFETRNNQDTYYTWWATPSITQTGSDDLAATYAHTQTAQDTIVYNPEWLSKDRALIEKGNQATLASMRSNHAVAMEGIAQWGRISRANSAASMARIKSNAAASAERQEQIIAGSNARMAQNDRQNELFTDAVINGEAKYSNPDSGERVKLDSSYNHTYTDNGGNYFQSNTPLQPGEVNWQEMEKVPFDDY